MSYLVNGTTVGSGIGSPTFEISPGDTFQIRLNGILDWVLPLPTPGPNLTIPFYESAIPQYTIYADLSDISGLSVKESIVNSHNNTFKILFINSLSKS